jgi:hypothetical protein
MALNLEFTDKAQATLQAAIQLAQDHANSQGMSVVSPLTPTRVAHYVVYCSISRTHCVCTLE